jgi:hypothetical protein
MLAANVSGLCEEWEIEAQMFNKPQMLIKAQMFNLALLPLFRKTLVGGSCFTFLFALCILGQSPPSIQNQICL